MLSISAAKTAGGAASYFSEHLTTENAANPHEDYYTAGGTPGHWIGLGAERLGLTNDVNKEDFARILLALDENGESLLYRQKPDASRRAGWDLTFSAPKSVSAIWATADGDLQQKIQHAHDEAVKSAMDYLQTDGGIAARRGKGGEILESAKLVAAVFQHGTSREQDPQLHSHVFTMNLAQRQDGSWGGIQSREIFNRKMETGAYYRVALAEKLSELGFAIEQDGRSFKVADVPEKLVKDWSKRRAQVIEKMAEAGGMSSRSAEAAALSTRKAKDEIEQKALKQRWQHEAAQHDFTAEKINEIRQHEKEPRTMPDYEQLWRALTEQRSTVTAHQLKAAVFEAAQGILSTTEAQQYYKDLVNSHETVILSGDKTLRFTSREMFELEASIIEQSKQRQNEQHQVSDQALQAAHEAAPGLSDEQQKMVEHITGRAGISAAEGMAGTGKSYALKAARAAWEHDGKTVIGAALAGKAAAGLQDGSGIQSQTLHSLLDAIEKGKKELSNNTVLVVDESGMIGSRQLKKLLDHAAENGSKVVLVGDSKQLQPIDAGAAFRGLSDELGAASLTQIRRQNEDWARQAVTLFSGGEAGLALEMYKARDLLRSGKTHDDTIKTLIDDYKRHIEQQPDNIKNSLILAATRSDVKQINQAAREALADRLGDESIIINNREFRENDRILFTRNHKQSGISNGDLGTVVAVKPDENRLIVNTDSGKQLEIDIARYDHVDHGYAVTAHKSQGATVDHAFVLAHEHMSSRSWSYVAASRARDETVIYADSATLDNLDVSMSRSDAKDFSQDYQAHRHQHDHDLEC